MTLAPVPDYIRNLPFVAAYTFLIYVFLVVGFRLLGRRQLGQLTVIDLVVIIVMGSAVETAMVNGNTSLPAGFVSAGTLLLTNRLLSFALSRSKWLRHRIGGGAMLLVNYGHIVEEHLRRAGLTHADVEQALRARGYDGPAGVKFAVLEEDGEINVVPMDVKTLHAQLTPSFIPRHRTAMRVPCRCRRRFQDKIQCLQRVPFNRPAVVNPILIRET